MFNRLTGWWSGGEPQPHQTDEERGEEGRQRRLRQFGAVEVEQGPVAPATATLPSTGKSTDNEVPADDDEDLTPTLEEGRVVGGSAVVREVTPDSDNPWATEWADVESSTVQAPSVASAEEESLAISRVFLVTVSTESQSGSRQPKYQTILLGVATSHDILSLSILDEVIFERLSLSDEEITACSYECGSGRNIPTERLIIPYLLGCVARASRERADPHIQAVLESCRKTAVRMIGVVLLSNDAWSPQDPAFQLTSSLISREDVFVLTPPEHDPMGCLQEIISSEDTEVEDLVTMMYPILNHVITLSRDCSLSTAPRTLALLNTLNTLTANRAIAGILPDLEGWTPKNPDDGSTYQGTTLGRFLCCSTIRIHSPTQQRYTSPYFSRSVNNSHTVTQHSQSQYQSLMDNIQGHVAKLFLNLIKSDAQDSTLHWLTSCLEANRNKAKLVASFVMSTGASDGFMLNLSSVLLKLCIPFLGPQNSKMCSIDARFCGPNSTSIMPQPQEDRILPIKEDAPLQDMPDSFNFITKCFYLTHRALQLAYIAPFDKYRRLMKSLMETQNLVQSLGSGPMPPDVRERFESMFVEQLEVKTHLMSPDTITQVLLFYASSANWMSQLSVSPNGTSHVSKMGDGVTFPVPQYPSSSLSMIPSYFISTSCQFLINLRYFAEISLENFLHEHLDHLLTFLVLFCSKDFVGNPHTRAEIVEALTVFVPNERSKVTTLNREAALCSNRLAAAKLGEKLIGVFVDVEQSSEFEHKFQYRYHVFELLDYIWPRQEFGLSSLSVEVRGREEDTTVLFTKFLQLLMNDANFLLDESFRQLEEIRKLEQLQDTEEWSLLDETARAGKLRSLAQMKRACTYYNMMSSETVKCLQYMSSLGGEPVTYAFVTPLLVDTLTTMLNYYLKELVSDTQIKYKIKNLQDVKFHPDKLLIGISEIYINLREQPAFISAIPRDGRSYHSALFTNAVAKLRKLQYSEEKIEMFLEVSELAAEAVTSEEVEGILTERAPEHYLDPILGTLMTEPVLLPTSRVIVERSVIAKHLLSDPIDPFNRQPLSMADVQPDTELRDEISAWRRSELAKIHDTNEN